MIDFTLDHAHALLARTPAAVRALAGGMPEVWMRTPEDGGWSVFDVIGHLIAGEEHDWIPRARMILDHGESREFVPFNREAMFEASRGKSIAELLDAFDATRAASLDALRAMNLTEADLDRRGTHPAFGAVTLRQLLATWVTHDHSHIAQIGRILARHHRDAVGPWKAYLSVL